MEHLRHISFPARVDLRQVDDDVLVVLDVVDVDDPVQSLIVFGDEVIRVSSSFQLTPCSW